MVFIYFAESPELDVNGQAI